MANSVDDLLGSTEPVFDPNKSYGTPTNILDGVLKTESGGKQYAINPKTKAMGPYQFMPETIADMHSKGIKFDPLDPVQARNAADYYLQQLAAKNGGDYNKALAQFGGFQKKDPTAYVASVNSGGPTPVVQKPQNPINVAAAGQPNPVVQADTGQPAAATKPSGITSPKEAPDWFMPGSTSEAIVRGFSQGATLGLGNKIQAQIQRNWNPDVSYEQARDTESAANAYSRQQHPIAYNVAQGAGMAPAFAATRGKALPLFGVGAVQGAGETGKDTGDVIENALKSGAITLVGGKLTQGSVQYILNKWGASALPGIVARLNKTNPYTPSVNQATGEVSIPTMMNEAGEVVPLVHTPGNVAATLRQTPLAGVGNQAVESGLQPLKSVASQAFDQPTGGWFGNIAGASLPVAGGLGGSWLGEKYGPNFGLTPEQGSWVGGVAGTALGGGSGANIKWTKPLYEGGRNAVGTVVNARPNWVVPLAGGVTAGQILPSPSNAIPAQPNSVDEILGTDNRSGTQKLIDRFRANAQEPQGTETFGEMLPGP